METDLRLAYGPSGTTWISRRPEKGKDICDYARYYIEERKGSARVGQEDHDYYKERIVNLIYNSGLKCGYEAPSRGLLMT